MNQVPPNMLPEGNDMISQNVSQDENQLLLPDGTPITESQLLAMGIDLNEIGDQDFEIGNGKKVKGWEAISEFGVDPRTGEDIRLARYNSQFSKDKLEQDLFSGE